MTRTTPGATRLGLGATVLAALTMVVATAGPAAADPVGAGEASAFGGQVQLTDQDVVPPTALAESDLASEDASASAVEVPADPLTVVGVLNGSAAVHPDADLDSLLTEVEQEVAGPYNARAVGSVTEAEVLIDAAGEGVPLLTASLIRAEAVGVCRGGAVEYSANSEVLELKLGDQSIPLNGPLTDIITGINTVLAETTLNQVVNIEQNRVTPMDDGLAVDALVIEVLVAAGPPAVATITLGHAEVGGLACGDAPQCSDGTDNDGDGLVDADDPGCHTDGDANNPDSYDPLDDDETDAALPGAPADAAAAQPTLPATGGDSTSALALAGLLGAGSLGMVALRRRLF
jgi:LPXTG-motif cell wall-anchored protein